MNKWQNAIALSLLVSVLWSCSSLEKSTTVSLELFKPAKLQIPADRQNIGIIYRNPVIVPDTAEIWKKSAPENDSTGIYARNPAAYHYIETFRQLLSESQRFNDIELIQVDVSKDVVDSLKIREITPEAMDGIRLKYPGTDIFLFSEYLNQQIFNYYYREISEYTMVVYTYSIWQMAGINEDHLAYQYYKTDTVWWQGYATSKKDWQQKFPSEEQAKIEGAGEAARAFSRLFVPWWETVERLIYLSGNYEMKIAHTFAINNQWKEAADIWRKYTTNKNRLLVAKAMFNMALANEVYGEMEGAIDWAIQSYMVFNETNDIHSRNTKDYISKLVARKKEYEILDKALLSPEK